jgi:hypothetical protein
VGSNNLCNSSPDLLFKAVVALFNAPHKGIAPALRQRACVCTVAGAPIYATPACSPPPPQAGVASRSAHSALQRGFLYTLVASPVDIGHRTHSLCRSAVLSSPGNPRVIVSF